MVPGRITHRSVNVRESAKAANRLEFQVVTRFVPTTFLERGVAVPFTTPRLVGARARPGERSTLELVAPNPSGARGVYILPWGHIDSLCSPTVHDRCLTGAVAALRSVTPAAIRHTAREIAARGLAGRGAREAARRARENENQASLQANFDLLLELVRQVEAPGENPVPPEQDRPAAVEVRGKRAVARLAPRLRWQPEMVVERLEQVAGCFGSIGIGHDARISAAIARLVRLRREVAECVAQEADDNKAEIGLITSTADLTIHLAKTTLAAAQALSGDIAALLQRWATDSEAISRLVARPDWLLDGWDHICALWELDPASGATIHEIASLVPVVPREADEWLTEQIGRPADLSEYRHRLVREREDWRTGATVCDLIARNERLLEKTL